MQTEHEATNVTGDLDQDLDEMRRLRLQGADSDVKLGRIPRKYLCVLFIGVLTLMCKSDGALATLPSSLRNLDYLTFPS